MTWQSISLETARDVPPRNPQIFFLFFSLGLCAQNRIPPGSLVWAGAGSLPAPTFVLPYPPTLWVSIMEPPTTYCGFAAALAAAPL